MEESCDGRVQEVMAVDTHVWGLVMDRGCTDRKKNIINIIVIIEVKTSLGALSKNVVGIELE